MTGEPTQSTRAVLVTGAARGLAQGIVVDLAARGYRVAFTHRPGGSSPQETLALVRARGADAVPIACDHALEGATTAAVHEAQAALGGIEILVHAVGPMIVRRFERMTPEDYRAMLDTNVRSAVEAAQAVLPAMRAAKFGRLVFFGMKGSQATQPARGLTLYGAAKAAVVAFARALALEEGKHGITVNAIEPGDISDKTIARARATVLAADNATGHAGSWEDIADAVRFLIADEAGFLNGAVLAVDGGMAAPHG
jgi:3-oxoacyl-[acyl-carrier protein] reductase